MQHFTGSTNSVRLKAVFQPRSQHLRQLTDAYYGLQFAVATANEKSVASALIILDREVILSYIED